MSGLMYLGIPLGPAEMKRRVLREFKVWACGFQIPICDVSLSCAVFRRVFHSGLLDPSPKKTQAPPSAVHSVSLQSYLNPRSRYNNRAEPVSKVIILLK